MVPSDAQPPKRVFAAGFFALVALGTAALLSPFLLPPSRQWAIAMPFLAAACAYVWAWVLYPRDGAELYGALRGVGVALLAYLSFTAILAVSGYPEAGLLLAGFLWTPFPWLVLTAGAATGGTNLRNVRARIDASAAFACRVWATCVAAVRATYARLDQWAADPRAFAIVTMIVSGSLLFAGGALGLAWLSPRLASAGEGLSMSQRLLPGMVALILAVTGRTCGRALLAVMPAAHRLHVTLTAVAIAGVSAVWFSINLVA
ncbi:hypothetical protein C0Q88_17645 [Ralstonia pickettii]|uniref:Transmembrane protein n=2 Tax=Ralstonia TaxID=48736 RepID=A0A2N4TNY5_RALPI|nr:hypothetical protein C0Q88_17645 [Ralstonia pickettii]